MTQEDKELLLKDLCARLPYRIKCYISEINDYRVLGSIQYDGVNTLFDFWNKEQTRYEFQLYISEFRPCLFPISSMTEEQIKEAVSTKHKINLSSGKVMYLDSLNTFEIYNKNHIDYKVLIEKGLAIDATGKNIY